MIGRFGYGEKNREREDVFGFWQSQRLRIINKMFQKSRGKSITFKSGEVKTQIEFILMRKIIIIIIIIIS